MRPATLLRVWAIISAAAIGLLLGSTPLLDADEGRNAEVGREMAVTNDYLVPHLDGLPYLDKPVVYFAAEAAAMEILGPTELAARLPAYLFTLATAFVVFLFARRHLDEERALIAVIAYLAMPLTIAFARTVIFDSALTFFIVIAIAAFFEAVETREKKWATLAWIAIAFGVLTKGPVAIVLPLFVAIPYALWRKAFRTLWTIVGFVAFVVIIAPWVWAVSQVVPEFLRYVLVTETAQRLATKELQRTGPPWYFIPYLIGGALPWSLTALASWRAWKSREPLNVYVLLWIAVPFIFFSISQSKRPQYILPLMPAVALLIATAWPAVKLRATAILVAVVGVLLLVAPMIPKLTAKMKPEIASPVKTMALILGALLVIGGIVAALSKRRDLAVIAMSLPLLAFPVVATPVLHAVAERRSTHGLVQELTPHLQPGTEIIGVEAFAGSLAFYLRQPIVLASDDATEFTSNYLLRRYDKFSRQTGPLRPLSWYREDLDRCCARRVYIVRSHAKEYRAMLEARGMRPIAEDARHVAYGPWTGPK